MFLFPNGFFICSFFFGLLLSSNDVTSFRAFVSPYHSRCLPLSRKHYNIAYLKTSQASFTPTFALSMETPLAESAKTILTTRSGHSLVPLAGVGSTSLFAKIPTTVASVNQISSTVKQNRLSSWQELSLWAFLFFSSALLHSTESAITKLSTWKIKELAEEEGISSPFHSLNQNITRFLISILLTTTAFHIYSTALFISSIKSFFPNMSLGAITAALTFITLFFGELLPKAFAVSNSEFVARKFLPFLVYYSSLLSPLTRGVTFLSDFILKRIFRMKNVDDSSVSEDMVRIVVKEAEKNNKEGIESGEGRMIKNVLDMEEKEVTRIMKPRMDIVGVSETASTSEILSIVLKTKYSRIPVYRHDIDHIVGVLFSKDLLDLIKNPSLSSDMKPELSEKWNSLTAKDIMEKPFFIPETMSCWHALQEMKQRKVHMAFIIDEYGGTSGLITFEDLLEEVIGEIYDEDDRDEEQSDHWKIIRSDNHDSYQREIDNSLHGIDRQAGGDGEMEKLLTPSDLTTRQHTLLMKSDAELDDVFEALNINYREGRNRNELPDIGESSTIGGLLCFLAGRIPKEGDSLCFAGYKFYISKVEDNRKIVDIVVSPANSVPESEVTPVRESHKSERFEAPLMTFSTSRIPSPSLDMILKNQIKPDGMKPPVKDSRTLSQKSSESKNEQEPTSRIKQPEEGIITPAANRILIFVDGEWVIPAAREKP
jgi:putative hemolysin